MELLRVYKQRIKRSHPFYEQFKELSIKSKNLFNLALYTERQYYFTNKQLIPRFTLSEMLQPTEAYKSLPAKTSQQIIHQVYQTMNSFLKSIKDFNNHPEKYKGKPKLPRYKDKQNGRYPVYFDYQQLKLQLNTHLKLPNNLGILRLPRYLESKELKIKSSKFSIDTTTHTELIQLRIIPSLQDFNIEFVYTESIQDPPKPKHNYIASIDLGLDNFAAIAFFKPSIQPILLNGKGLKSYNQWFNKTLASLKSNASKQNHKTTNRIQKLYAKRNRYLNTWMHQASRLIVNHLLKNEISTLVVGHNKYQKQQINLGPKTNQSFVQIPYNQFLSKLTYKCQEAGIQLFIVEESYTSGTSFLDNEEPTKTNYTPSRRKHRGLLVSNQSIPINADINAAYQIMKKAYPNMIQYHPSLVLNPLKLNVA